MTGDWYDAFVEARRRLSGHPGYQTFYVIKRSDGKYFDPEDDSWWSYLSPNCIYASNAVADVHIKRFELDARIVKIEVKEIEG